MKKFLVILLAVSMTAAMFTGCKNKDTQKESSLSEETFDLSKEITVISREEGSGTRGAFTELFNIIEKDSDGNKVDMTTEYADVTQSTGVMLKSVEDNKYAIGYISLGSLNDSVKALKIDGAVPSVETIKDNSYKIGRPFNIATMGDVSETAQDFINFILSDEGQKIVEQSGYVSKESKGKFVSSNPQGKISISGSSSVTPVMEKLKEAYEKINDKTVIEISQSDSTNGMNSVADGISQIGMASRELKESELAKGLNPTVIALDGIAVIVNKENGINELSSEDVKGIYMGNVNTWESLNR